MNEVFEAAGMTVFERGWLSSNNVLFAAVRTGASVLVDSGYASHASQTVALVQHALGERGLTRVVNTHLHSDHCGGNFALQQAFGCAVDIPGGEAEKVDRWDEEALTYGATGQVCPRFVRSGLLGAGDETVLGELPWKVCAAPGHDPESVILYQPRLKILISADALWENGFGVVFPELDGEAAFAEVGKTLDVIEGLAVDWVIPGHGPPFQCCSTALERARTRLQSFESDPARHAWYAAKVLIKFHLLEVTSTTFAELAEWISSTRYLKLCHSTHFSRMPFEIWSRELLSELARNRALRIDGSLIANS